jgi:hypothetical protein
MDAIARREVRRAELERWIGESLRLQRRLPRVVVPIGVAGAAASAWLWPLALPFVILTAIAFVLVGRYITAAHIADWRLELRNLDRPPAPIEGREP